MAAPLPPDKRINYRLNLISHGWSALVLSLTRARHRLNPAAMKILTVVARYQPISPSELVTRTVSDSPKVARAVGQLVEAGLVERIPDPIDGRRALLSVTPEGMRIYEDIDSLAALVEGRLTAALTEAEHEALQSILEKLETAIHQQLRGSRWSDLADAGAAAPTPRPRGRRAPKT